MTAHTALPADGARAVQPGHAAQRIDIAQAINAEHAAAHSDARSALDRARRCGVLLIEAKAQREHGEWLPWIAANLTFGPRQAQKYVRLAEQWDRLPNANPDSLLPSIDAALASMAEPRPLTPRDRDELEACELTIFHSVFALFKGCVALRELRDLMLQSPYPEIASFEQYSLTVYGLGTMDITARMKLAAIFDAMGAPQTLEEFRAAFRELQPGEAHVAWEVMLPP